MYFCTGGVPVGRALQLAPLMPVLVLITKRPMELKQIAAGPVMLTPEVVVVSVPDSMS